MTQEPPRLTTNRRIYLNTGIRNYEFHISDEDTKSTSSLPNKISHSQIRVDDGRTAGQLWGEGGEAGRNESRVNVSSEKSSLGASSSSPPKRLGPCSKRHVQTIRN